MFNEVGILHFLLGFVLGHVCGSVPSGLWLVQAFHGIDIRNYGSKNIGTTNVFRTVGPKTAVLVLIADAFKGILAVGIMSYLFHNPLLDVITALGALLGHNYSLFLGFKGGKGVLVAGGTILAIQPVLIPFLAVIFLACLLPTGMVSLGSVTMAALYPVLTILYGVFRGYSAADLTVCAIGSVIMGAMVIYMHRSNIQRIREGKEYRFGRHGKK